MPELMSHENKNKNWDTLYINGQILEFAKLRVVRDIKRMDNSKIAKLWFYKLKKNLEIC